MTEVFGRLNFDEDVSARVAQLVRARGFDILTTLEAKRLGSTDRSQLEFATVKNRALVTHNRQHFEQLAKTYFETQTAHAGIIIAVRRPPRDLAERLLGILNRSTSDELFNDHRLKAGGIVLRLKVA